MVWFRVDDGWHKHRKRIRTGLDLEGMAAQGLWAAAGSWCSDELSDGFIPDDVVDYLAPGVGQTLAKRLEAARLWVRDERDGESGWTFHQWVEQQPTREEVEAVTSKKSSGGKLGNHRRWHAEAGKVDPKCPFCRSGDKNSDWSPDRTADRRSDGSSESGANPPTRPDPTSSSNEEEGSPSAPDSEDEIDDLGGDDTTKKGTRVAASFRPTPQMVEWFRKKCPDVDGPAETTKFVNYWLAKPGKDGLKLSWKRTWQNWMTSAQQRINDRNKNAGRFSNGLQPESNAPKNYAPDERCPQHPSNPAGKCGSCRAEQLAAKRSA